MPRQTRPMTSGAAPDGRRFPVPVVAGWCAAAVAVIVVYLVVASGAMVMLGRGPTPTLASSVAATALVAVAVRPVRRRVEGEVARRWRPARPSPYELLSAFARESAAESAAAPAVIARMLAMGTGVALAEVWVLTEGQPQLVASYPPGETVSAPPPTPYDTAPQDGVRVVAVTHGRSPLGVLRVLERPGHPLTVTEEGLLTGLAAQAGMVLQRAQLSAELALRLEQLTDREAQLREARLQLVATQDRERRRLERDIHDGAQQQLVALAINLKLARALWCTDPEGAAGVLEEQLAATAHAIRTLTDLAGGLLPHSLAAHGLVEALTEATRDSPVPVEVTGEQGLRQPPSVEAAVYFCVLEAVQNATKHAGATRIAVQLRSTGSELTVQVSDDGRGMPSTPVEGAGLGNIRERIAALGGKVVVGSPGGRGTSITASVPLAVPVGAG